VLKLQVFTKFRVIVHYSA